MRSYQAIAVLLAAAACSGETAHPVIPVETVQLSGAQFDAYRLAGDTFRIVCQQPCPVPPPSIFALHVGMTRAKDAVLALTGIDALPELAPVDVHITADAVCPKSTIFAGYSTIGPNAHGLLCLFTWESSQGGHVPPFIDDEITHQTLFAHEYSHVIFFGRHEVSWESVVRAISYRVTGFIPDPCDLRLTDYSARLIRELCVQDGFSYSDLAPSLQALEAVYQAGLGEADPGSVSFAGTHPPTSVYQWRKILDRRLGKLTLAAFMDADELPWNALGDSVTLTPAGGRFALYRGALTLDLPAGAIDAPIDVTARCPRHLGSLSPGWEDFVFATVVDLEPRSATFSQPATLTLAYDRRVVPTSHDPATLRLMAGTDVREMHLVPGSTTDVAAATVQGAVQGLGYFFAEPPP